MRILKFSPTVAIALALGAPALAARVATSVHAPHVVTGMRSERIQGEFRWHGRLEPGRVIEIRGVNGDVRAVRGSGTQVEVTAKAHAEDGEPGEVEIRVIEHEAGITICAVYPGVESQSPDCGPVPSDGGLSAGRSASVDFQLRVPPGVTFIGRTVKGSVEAQCLAGDVEAYTVDGSIGLSAAGHVLAETVNGSIRASLDTRDWERPLELRTVNGGITVELRPGTNTQVRAATINGEISTEFPLRLQETSGPKSVAGTIGKGGAELNVATVNGRVELLRAREEE